MKNFLAIVLCVFTLCLLSAPVLAQPYISVNGGIVTLSDSDLEGAAHGEMSFDAGFGVLAALGVKVTENSRIEAEIGYRGNDIDKVKIDGVPKPGVSGDVTTLSLMGNMFYDFMPDEFFSPFIGVGFGLANIEGDIDGFHRERDNVFAYQAAIGGTYAANRQVSLDVQYRFFATDDANLDGLEAEYQSHNVLVGLRFNF